MVSRISARTYLQQQQIFPSIIRPIGSGLKHVATGSVSGRYQTNLYPQLSETLLENVKSFLDLNCRKIKIQND